ncbi:MAG: class I adenylate-forming enzyme family protein, partial [Mycobacteriales bacterium]
MTSPAIDFVSSYAESQPDWPAVIDDGAVMTWARLEETSNRWANALLQLGVSANTKIVWCGMNSTEVVVVITAARKVGAVAVPLNYRLSSAEAGYVIDNSDATVVLFDIEQVEQMDPARALCPKVQHWLTFRARGAAVPSWASEIEQSAEGCSPAPPRSDGSATGATMIYTSGTTGKPKGALRRGGNNPEQAMALFSHIGYQPREVYLTTGPLYHSGPLGFMAPPLMLGGTVVIQRKFNPENWLRLVAEHRVTTTFSAPTPIRRVLDLPAEVIARYDTSSLARFIANAAPWPFELKRRYVDAFGDTSLWEVYGSTELGVDTVMA